MSTQVKPMRVFSADFWKEKVELGQATQHYSRWEAFAYCTTLHGLRHVFERGYSIAKRVVWLILLSSASFSCLYLNSLCIKKFISKPIKTVISQETPDGGLKFPAVTICNLNRFMKSKIDVADDDEKFEKMGLNISGCSEIRAVRGNLTCGQALLCAHAWFGTALVNGCNATRRQNIIDVLNRSSERLYNEEEFFTKYGHDMESMFMLYCRFMHDTVCSEKDFVPTLTSDGLCFTFNSGQNDTIFHALLEGPELGLNIVLNAQTNESTISDFSNGFKVILHDQNTFVSRHYGFNILPGAHALVAIKLRKHIRLPAPFLTNCRQKKLPGIGSYTKNGCIYQCIANTTLANCGCRRIGMPEPREVPLCSLQDSRCVTNTRRQVNVTECPCNNACSELEYEATVSYSKFPDNSIIQILHKLYGKMESSSYMKENYVFLQVGFQHLAYEKREDVPSYEAESLFGEIGGNAGLFVGCSLLTACEFINFLWDTVKFRIRKRTTNVSAELSNA